MNRENAGRQRQGSAIMVRPSKAAVQSPCPGAALRTCPEPPPRPLTFKGVWAAQGEQEADVAILNHDPILAVSVHTPPFPLGRGLGGKLRPQRPDAFLCGWQSK